jgi:tocopherol O-methyltransferase
VIVPNEVQKPGVVAEHDDELDPFYRDIWGEHIHHGFWVTGRETPEQAMVAIVKHVAGKLWLQAEQSICDVGCGYGASAECWPNVMASM